MQRNATKSNETQRNDGKDETKRENKPKRTSSNVLDVQPAQVMQRLLAVLSLGILAQAAVENATHVCMLNQILPSAHFWLRDPSTNLKSEYSPEMGAGTTACIPISSILNVKDGALV